MKPHTINLEKGILLIEGDVVRDFDLPEIKELAFSSRVDLSTGETINLACQVKKTDIDLLIGSGNGPFARLDLPTADNISITTDNKIKVKGIRHDQRICFARNLDQDPVVITYLSK